MKDIGVVGTTERMTARGFDSPRLHSRECNSAVESRFSKPMVEGSNPFVRFMSDNRQHSAGKGDKPRPFDYKKWSDNWDRIFGKKKKKKVKKNAN